MSNVLSTSMTRLIDKLERRLGTRPLNLPAHLQKTEWGKVIEEDTLDTFSRFFPHKLPYVIDTANDQGKDGYYYIDQHKIPGDVTILGIRDLAFERLRRDSSFGLSSNIYPSFNIQMGFEDVSAIQMSADLRSVTDNNIYIDFIPPNKLSIQNTMSIDMTLGLGQLPIEVFVKHSKNLATISATKMETFEALASLDVQIFLYNELKYFDGLETVFANIDLKMSEWQSAQDKRESMVEKFENQYISAANKHQPMMFTV